MQWERGTPTFGFGPYSSPNSWTINLDGTFLTGTTEYLFNPRLANFDTVVRAELRFYESHNLGGGSSPNFNASGTFEFHDGQGFRILGGDRVGLGGSTVKIGVNWWDGANADLQVGLFGNNPGWLFHRWSVQYTMYPFNEFNRNPNDSHPAFCI
ncbi:MAG: hypothetical protein U5L96_05590 [Owenweeksia sp.]|nr:hypothetical protein [Owenweeksia sp.]